MDYLNPGSEKHFLPQIGDFSLIQNGKRFSSTPESSCNLSASNKQYFHDSKISLDL